LTGAFLYEIAFVSRLSQSDSLLLFLSLPHTSVLILFLFLITVGWSPIVIFILGVSVFLFTDDCPYGSFKELKNKETAADKAATEAEVLKTGGEPGTVAAKSLIAAATSWQVCADMFVVCRHVCSHRDTYMHTYGHTYYCTHTPHAHTARTHFALKPLHSRTLSLALHAHPQARSICTNTFF